MPNGLRTSEPDLSVINRKDSNSISDTYIEKDFPMDISQGDASLTSKAELKKTSGSEDIGGKQTSATTVPSKPRKGSREPRHCIDVNGKKRYPCPFPGCDKTFSTSGHSSRHSRIHTGERPYRCSFPGCNAQFSRYDNSLQHYRTHIISSKGKKSRSKSKDQDKNSPKRKDPFDDINPQNREEIIHESQGKNRYQENPYSMAVKREDPSIRREASDVRTLDTPSDSHIRNPDKMPCPGMPNSNLNAPPSGYIYTDKPLPGHGVMAASRKRHFSPEMVHDGRLVSELEDTFPKKMLATEMSPILLNEPSRYVKDAGMYQYPTKPPSHSSMSRISGFPKSPETSYREFKPAPMNRIPSDPHIDFSPGGRKSFQMHRSGSLPSLLSLEMPRSESSHSLSKYSLSSGGRTMTSTSSSFKSLPTSLPPKAGPMLSKPTAAPEAFPATSSEEGDRFPVLSNLR